MSIYKIITRIYFENQNNETPKEGKFIAQGQWADGHLAYSRLDNEENIIEECAYIQRRFTNGGLYMERI